MRGALKVTYQDGTEEFFDVDPAGGAADVVGNLKSFLTSPNIALVLDNEFVIIPSTSIRRMSITRKDVPLPLEELAAIPGVLVDAKRLVA